MPHASRWSSRADAGGAPYTRSPGSMRNATRSSPTHRNSRGRPAASCSRLPAGGRHSVSAPTAKASARAFRTHDGWKGRV